jgi:lipopolysaccharide/colanic/teichoic acid biosynthesis glycosyltransferase
LRTSRSASRGEQEEQKHRQHRSTAPRERQHGRTPGRSRAKEESKEEEEEEEKEMFFRTSRSRGGPGWSAEIPGAARERDFASILRRERDRADRNSDVFTLVALELSAAQRSDAAWCRTLGRIVRNRLRSTDDAGWLPNGRLGIVLPHTPEPGGWTFARALKERLEAKVSRHSPLRFTVSSYNGGGGRRDKTGPTDEWGKDDGGTPVPEPSAALVGIAPAGPDGSTLRELLMEPPGRAKRLFDVSLASLGLIPALPVMALAAVAIKCTSKGPVLFRQQRAGYGGRPFTFYKLRTMIDGAEEIKDSLADFNEADGPVFKMADDPRITFVGRILRKTSIDELPQLWNVLRGDMSIVGPRPPTLDEIGEYESWQRRRLHCMGGLTCLWQVGGRSNLGFLEWVRLDLRYLKRRSLWLDLVLILRTIPAVIAGRGAK